MSSPQDPSDEVAQLSDEGRRIWDDAAATTWGRDNGRSFYARIAKLADRTERIRLGRLLMDRQHASMRALQQVVYEAWREDLPTGQLPVAHRADYSDLVDRGEEFRAAFAGLLDTMETDAERAEMLTILVDDSNRWLGELRDLRDEAIMNTLAAGYTPRQLARRLQLSRTQIVNVRHRYLRDLEAVGASSKEIVYRSSGGVVAYVNQAYEAVTGFAPEQVIGQPVDSLGYPEDQEVVLPMRDEAVGRGHGRFRHRVRLRTADGGSRLVDADFSVITNPDTGEVEVHAHARPVGGQDAPAADG